MASDLTAYGDGARGLKLSSALVEGGTLYLLERNLTRSGGMRLGRSASVAEPRVTWTGTLDFGWGSFAQASPDGYEYVYLRDSRTAYGAADRVDLARVPKGRVADLSAWEVFAGSPADPSWVPWAKRAARKPVLSRQGPDQPAARQPPRRVLDDGRHHAAAGAGRARGLHLARALRAVGPAVLRGRRRPGRERAVLADLAGQLLLTRGRPLHVAALHHAGRLLNRTARARDAPRPTERAAPREAARAMFPHNRHQDSRGAGARQGGGLPGPGRLGERQVSLRTGAVLVVGRSVAWRTPVAQADRPFLLDHFAALEDPRQRAKVLYPLPEILLLLLCATLAGADDVVEIALWGDEHLAFLRRFLPCEHGVPSHDTLGAVIAALDPELFKACFAAWVEGLREAEPDLIAIDGKTSRRSHARSKGRGPLHLVSAWATRQRLVLGQEAVAGKSNEIAAIPLLLERLALEGALVTIDAIGAQGAIAEVILRRGGDYLLALEGEPAGHPQGRRGLLRRAAAGVPSTPSRPPTATTAGSRSAGTRSATTWPGCSRTGATRARSPSRAWP